MIENLTQEQRMQITREEIEKQPSLTIGTTALLILANYGIRINAAEIQLKQIMTIGMKSYKGKLLVTWKEIDGNDEEE